MKLELYKLELFASATISVACAAGCGSIHTIEDNPDAAGGLQSQAPAALWARTTLSPTTESLFSSTAVDASGNVYAAGEIWGPGTLDFGNGVTPTGVSAGYNALVVKYDSSGTAQWGRTSTAQPGQTVSAGSNGSSFSSVAVDSSGNIYAAGATSGASGPVDFGNGVRVVRTDTFANAVLVKYDPLGIAQWARAVTAGSSYSGFSSVAVDPSGNVYVAGEIDGNGTYNFGDNVTATGTATNAGYTNSPGNAVLAKYDSSGVAQWAQTVTAGSPASGFGSVAVDSAGNVFAAGSIAGTGTYDFGHGITATGTASQGHIANEAVGNSLLVKYNSSGIPQWAQTVTAGTSGSVFGSVAVDSAGNAYAAGSVGSGTHDFGNGVTATGTSSVIPFAGPVYGVILKYDSSGIANWAQTVNGGPNSYFDSVSVDFSGSVYAAGSIDGYEAGTYDFGHGVTATATASAAASGQGAYHVALVKYDSSGIAQWARSSVNGGSVAAILTSVTVDSTDHLYTAGGIGSTGSAGSAGVVDFGNNVTATGTYVPSPGWSALLVKYQ